MGAVAHAHGQVAVGVSVSVASVTVTDTAVTAVFTIDAAVAVAAAVGRRRAPSHARQRAGVVGQPQARVPRRPHVQSGFGEAQRYRRQAHQGRQSGSDGRHVGCDGGHQCRRECGRVAGVDKALHHIGGGGAATTTAATATAAATASGNPARHTNVTPSHRRCRYCLPPQRRIAIARA